MIISKRNNILAFTLICATIGIQAAQNAPDLATPFTCELDISPINKEGAGGIHGDFRYTRQGGIKFPQRILFDIDYNKNNPNDFSVRTNPVNPFDRGLPHEKDTTGTEAEMMVEKAFNNVVHHCRKLIRKAVRGNIPMPPEEDTIAIDCGGGVTIKCPIWSCKAPATAEGIAQIKQHEKDNDKLLKQAQKKTEEAQRNREKAEQQPVEDKNAANKQPSKRLTITTKGVILGVGMLAAKKLYEHRETIASAVSLTVMKLTQGHASVV